MPNVRDALWATGHDESVEVNQRALIDKVLARYSGEFTVFRELLQNSDDAHAKEVEIRFETQQYLDKEGGTSTGDLASRDLPDLKTVPVCQWSFKNNGIIFREDDWNRLRKIAEGNPDEEKIGAFGVGFYSLFSVTEEPFVSSGSEWMGFYWKDNKDQLVARRGNLPVTSPSDPWTIFNMPLRESAPIPAPFDLTRFLASSVTFMTHLETISIFFNDQRLSRLNKSTGIPCQILWSDLSPKLEKGRTTEKGFMHVASLHKTAINIKAEVMHWVYISGTEKRPPPPPPPTKPAVPKSGGGFLSLFGFSTSRAPTPVPQPPPPEPPKEETSPLTVNETSVTLSIFSATIDVKLDAKLSTELQRSTKKRPPVRMKYDLIYTGKPEYDISREEDERLKVETGSIFQGLRADLHGAGSAKIFIGHSTGQTTGVGGHMSARFIPTVERESVDLVDRTVAIWNKELLYVGGFVCRCAYELELSNLRILWDGAKPAGAVDPDPDLQAQLAASALHALRFFTFHMSTPSAEISYLLQSAFFSCATPDIPIMSSVGVRSASTVRMPDPTFAEFLKQLPVVSKMLMDSPMIELLREKGILKEATFQDVLDELKARPLTEPEMIACLKWWTGLTRQTNIPTNPQLRQIREQLIDAALFVTTEGTAKNSLVERVVPLSIIKTFVNKKGSAGAHIPVDGSLPNHALPFTVSQHFSSDVLTSCMPWQELTVVDWLKYASSQSHDVEHDITLSPKYAEEVLTVLAKSLPSLHSRFHADVKNILMQKNCIPTSGGMTQPEKAYFANVNIFNDLPIVKLPSGAVVKGNMERLLEMLGVRKHVQLQMIFDKIKTGDWTINDLLKYLVSVRSTLSPEEMKRLKLTAAFAAELPSVDDVKSKRYKAQDLYEPIDIHRRLGLPIIAWDAQQKWRPSSEEAKFLFNLGLVRFPPLDRVIQLCAGENEAIRNTAIIYLLDNMNTHYTDYHPGSFAQVKYIPARKANMDCMGTPKEVYINSEWVDLGFTVLRSPPTQHDVGMKLKLQKHPFASDLVTCLQSRPPPDEREAKRWFEALAGRISDFQSNHLQLLAETPFVPTRSGKDHTLRYLPPRQCFFGMKARAGLHSKLFVFVDFGPLANGFLTACGTKHEPSVEEVCQMLLLDPHRFYEMANGRESFLSELRNIAINSSSLSSSTLAKLRSAPVLLGIRRKPKSHKEKTLDMDEDDWELQYDLKRSDQVVIADDTNAYQLFGDNLFSAPQEDILEGFYSQLGSKRLSSLVKEEYKTSAEIKNSNIAFDTRKLILERLPLFLHEHTLGSSMRIKYEWLNAEGNFVVKTFGKLEVQKSLHHDDVRSNRSQEASAAAVRIRAGPIQLWIANNAQVDMYEVATSLCRLMFQAPKPSDALLFMTILSTDLKALKRRGYNVDRILRKQFAERKAADDAIKAQQIELISRPMPTMKNEATAPTPVPPPIPPKPPLLHDRIPPEAEPERQASTPSLKESSTTLTDDSTRSARPNSGMLSRLQNRISSAVKNEKSPFNTIAAALNTSNPALPHASSAGASSTTTPLSNISSNIDLAISACRPDQTNLLRNREHMQSVKESLNEGYCDISGRGGDMEFVGQPGDYRVYVSKDVSQPQSILATKQDVLSRFNNVIKQLAAVYQLHPRSLHIFYDNSGDLIAFNRSASLFLNLRYFEEWHYSEVCNGKLSSAYISWYFTLAHEIAHNLVQPHNSEHEFYFSAICEKHLIQLGQLLSSSP